MTKVILDTKAKTLTLADGTTHSLLDFTVLCETAIVEDTDETGKFGGEYVTRKSGPFTFFTIRGSWLNK